MEAYYFSTKERELAYGDGRKIRVGGTHRITLPIALCRKGLHASKKALDALKYAKGSILFKVRLGGQIIESSDKLVASERKYLASFNASELLFSFAREQALSVADKWDCPSVVREFLETGERNLRKEAYRAAYSAASRAANSAANSAASRAANSAANSVAYSAANSVAYSVAYSAANSAAYSVAYSAANSAAYSVAYSAANSAAYSAARSAAYSVAYSEARSAAYSAANDRLTELVEEVFNNKLRKG